MDDLIGRRVRVIGGEGWWIEQHIGKCGVVNGIERITFALHYGQSGLYVLFDDDGDTTGYFLLNEIEVVDPTDNKPLPLPG